MLKFVSNVYNESIDEKEELSNLFKITDLRKREVIASARVESIHDEVLLHRVKEFQTRTGNFRNTINDKDLIGAFGIRKNLISVAGEIYQRIEKNWIR